MIQMKIMLGEVTDLTMYKIGDTGDLIRLGDVEVDDLLKIKGTAP